MNRFYAISNASETFFKDNKLTAFSNYLPSQLTLDQPVQVAIRSVGLHCNVNSINIAKNEPSLFYVRGYSFDFVFPDGKFTDQNWGKFSLTLPDTQYEPHSLAHKLEDFFKLVAKLKRIKCTVEDNNGEQFFVLENPTLFPALFFMRQELAEGLQLENDDYLTWNQRRYYKIKLNRRSRLKGKPFYGVPNFPQFYQVHCSLGRMVYDNAMYSGVIPIESNGTFYFKYNPVPKYYDITTTDLNQIDVKITGLDGQLLKLSRGQASVIEMEFIRKAKDQFTHLTLQNKDQHANHFVCQLKSAIQIREGKMALYSLILRNNIRNLKESMCQTPIHYAIVGQGGEPSSSSSFKIPPGYYPTLKRLCDTLTEVGPNGLKFGHERGHLTLEYNSSGSGIEVFLPNALSDIFGFEPSSKGVFNIELQVHGGESKKALSYPANLFHYYPAYVSVYSSHIRPVAVGENFYQILKMAPLKPKEKGLFQFYEVPVLEYSDITVGYLSNIAIQLRDPAGELIEFDSPTADVIINVTIKNKQAV